MAWMTEFTAAYHMSYYFHISMASPLFITI